MATSQDNLPSVVIFRLKNATPAFVIPRLTTILDECSELLESGVILIVENSRYRLRKLPID